MNKAKYLYAAFLLPIFIYLDGGNFYRMRKAAFSAFQNHMKEYEIDPTPFVGPILDVSDKSDLTFKWCRYDKNESDTLCILVSVPPYFSSFRAQVAGVGGTPEAWKNLSGAKGPGN